MTKTQWRVFLVILALGIVAVCLSISQKTVNLNVTVKDAYSIDPVDGKSHPGFNIYLREYQY